MKRTIAFLCAPLLFACTGQIGGPDLLGTDRAQDPGGQQPIPHTPVRPGDSPFQDDPPADSTRPRVEVPGPAFACDPNAAPSTTPLRRLTRLQFENTIADLVTLAVGSASEAEAVLGPIRAVLATRPDDARGSIGAVAEGLTFLRHDQVVSVDHVDAGYHIAKTVATKMVEGDRLGKVLGGCATDTDPGNDKACLSSFLKSWGARALRRPMTSDDLAFYTRFVFDRSAVDRTAVINVITGLLAAPRLSYLVEHGDGGRSGPLAPLTAFEMASRLSYQLWDTMPDDELWARAADGALMTSKVAKEQIHRLMSDPRGAATIKRFFREWLGVVDLSPLDRFKDQPAYKTFAQGLTPTPALRASMITEIDDLIQTVLLDRDGTIRDLVTTRLLFPRSTTLATIYRTRTWDGKGDPVVGDRVGVLTRAALVARSEHKTHPILRGVFVRGTFLCDVIPDPPANAAQDLPKVAPTMSGREQVEAITEQAGTSCAGCHKAFINPIGFVLERYDNLGRSRSTETVIDEDTGKILAVKPLDTSAVPAIEAGDETRVDSDAQLMTLIAKSHKLEACLARQLLRFSTARRENPVTDGCALERVRRALTTGTFEDGWLAMVTDGAFWARGF